MSELKTNEQPTKRRNSLWYIIGAAILLIIVYQSGRSTGIRSVSETIEHSASLPAATPPTAASPRTTSPPNTQPAPSQRTATTARERAAQQRATRPDNIPEHPTTPANFPVAPAPVATTPVIPGPPPGLLPSVIVAADPAQTPHPAPANSIYDRRTPGAITQASLNAAHQPSPGSIRPSETGLLPLAPLAPLPAGQSGAIPAVLRQPPSPGAVSIRPAVLCNCGKEH